MLGLDEDLLSLGEVPSLDSTFSLDFHLGIVELLLPFGEHIDTLVNFLDGSIWFLAEDTLNVDLGADFVTNLIRDAL